MLVNVYVNNALRPWSSDLPVERFGDFRNFSAIFGKATKLIGTVWITFVKCCENMQSIFLKIVSHLVSACYKIFQMIFRTAELYVVSNCY